MLDTPEGRCLVCRAAWEPCRKCKGQELRRKCEATMQQNGTARNKLGRGDELRWGTPPDSFKHRAVPKRRRQSDDNA